MRRTHYEASHCVFFLSLVLFVPTKAQVFLLLPCSTVFRTAAAYRVIGARRSHPILREITSQLHCWFHSGFRETGKLERKSLYQNKVHECPCRNSTEVHQLSSGIVINPLFLPIGYRGYFPWSGRVANCCLYLIQKAKENWNFFATSMYVISGVSTELGRGKLHIFKFLSVLYLWS